MIKAMRRPIYAWLVWPNPVVLFMIAVTGLVAAAPNSALALDPDRRISQYHHTRWTRADGVPTPVRHLAQSPDGFLWLAAGDGLYRFDGIRFEKIDAGPQLSAPVGLFAARNGEIWTWFSTGGRFAVYRQGQLRLVSAPSMEGGARLFAQTHDGAIWAGQAQSGLPTYRYHQGRWKRFQVARPIDQLTGMLVSADGTLWLTFVERVARLRPGSQIFETVFEQRGGGLRLVADPDGRVWMVEQRGVRAITGPAGRPLAVPSRDGHPMTVERRAGRMIFDRNGNLWNASWSTGLRRTSPTAGRSRQEDHFTEQDGLTSDRMEAILEDRDGNIWVGTTAGLDRFRNSAIITEPALTRPPVMFDSILAAADGTVYVARESDLMRIPAGGDPELVTTIEAPQGICQTADGFVWVLTANDVIGVRGDERVSVPRPSRDGWLFDCASDRFGVWWMSVGAGAAGMYRRAGAVWERVDHFDPVGPGMMARDAQGDLWAVSGPPGFARLTAQGWQEEPGTPAELVDLPMGSMVTTQRGIVVVLGAGLLRVTAVRKDFVGHVDALRGASGFVETPDGNAWVLSNAGLVRLRQAELDRAFRDNRFLPSLRVFSFEDGLPDRQAGQSLRGLVRGGDGRIWATTLAGTVWLDPARIPINRRPPPVAVTYLASRTGRWRDPQTVTLSPGASDISIGFAALSLAVPERVQVRYRLEGVDDDWIDPGQRREAYYTNLAPGAYRFTVIAANEDGVWNRVGSTVRFSIAPTFWQSVWFKLLVGLALLASGYGLYLLRLRVVTERLQEQFQIRLVERERIARELHDTLLQGVQALMLKVQAAAGQLPRNTEVRASLEATLTQAEQLAVEGRSRVKDLRRRAPEVEPKVAIAEAAKDAVGDAAPDIRCMSEGRPRPLAASSWDEIVRFCEEAVRNAVQHGRASTIDIILIYNPNEFRVSIRNDGVPLPPDVLARGAAEGRFGLLGMRERAQGLGGRLELSSDEVRGTRVDFIVPSRAAYHTSALNGPRAWLDWMQGRRK
jgi:signal transduction histidine kinase/streptogramin lyase